MKKAFTIPSPLTPLPQCERGRRRGFTLVELIVVITILAILGTISFISLQNYSKEARDSKRIQDVRSLLTKLNVENVKGTPYEDMLTNKEDYTKQIDGIEKPVTSGIVDFEYLRENRDNFLDPEYGIDYDFANAVGIAQYNSKDQGYNFIEGRYYSEKYNEEVILGNYYKYQPSDAENLFSGSINITKPIPPITPSCSNYTGGNGTVIENTPTSYNQALQGTNPSGACYVKCDKGYAFELGLCVNQYASTPGINPNGPESTICSGEKDIIITTSANTGLIIAPCNLTNDTDNGLYEPRGSRTNTLAIGNTIEYYYGPQVQSINPCPSPRRVPTKAEWNDIIHPQFSGKYVTGGVGAPFNLPFTGTMQSGSVINMGTIGNYRTSDPYDIGEHTWYVQITSSTFKNLRLLNQATVSLSLRCVRD